MCVCVRVCLSYSLLRPCCLMFCIHLVLAIEHTKMGQAFSKLMAQHNENEMVLKELKMLGEDSKVYKLVGPVLLSQVRVVSSTRD